MIYGAMIYEAMVSAPGRVNLTGEHIDYHGLPVLPIALRRSIRVTFQARADRRIQAVSEDYGERAFGWQPNLTPVARGDWENYLRAAAQAVAGKWGVLHGIDAAIESDLPPAAGLSSSSALIVAFTLALLRANRIAATFEELMAILPDGALLGAGPLARRLGPRFPFGVEPQAARPSELRQHRRACSRWSRSPPPLFRQGPPCASPPIALREE